MNKLDFETLKKKQKSLRDGFPQDLSLRVHRAISWGLRSEKESGDADVRFLLLWIGFNAAYTRIPVEFARGDSGPPERNVFKNYFKTLVSVDEKNRVYDAVWEKFFRKDAPTPKWVKNKFVFAPFWDHIHGKIGQDDWRKSLGDRGRRFNRARKGMNTVLLLTEVFDNLYTLRNQLMHGGATWDGDVNREQVNDGAEIMDWMLPIFIDLMMENPDQDWGKPFYPVVDR